MASSVNINFLTIKLIGSNNGNVSFEKEIVGTKKCQIIICHYLESIYPMLILMFKLFGGHLSYLLKNPGQITSAAETGELGNSI